MKAIIIKHPGDVDVLNLADIPAPSPKADEILVRNSYVGVNYGDVIKRRRGGFETGGASYYVAGFEGVGEVVGVGAEITTAKIGDVVGYLAPSGAYGEFIAVPAKQSFKVIAAAEQAVVAGSICVGLTAWNLLELSGTKPGDTALVHGGAGGVGSTLLQMARSRGIKSIATVGSDEKAAYAAACGADKTILHREGDFAAQVLAMTAGVGADVIFDCVGQSVVEGNARCIRENGRWLYYGSTSGHAAFPGMAILSRSIRLIGFVVFETMRRDEWWKRSVQALTESIEQKSFEPKVEVFPARDIRAVHRSLEERQFVGKAVLDMEAW